MHPFAPWKLLLCLLAFVALEVLEKWESRSGCNNAWTWPSLQHLATSFMTMPAAVIVLARHCFHKDYEALFGWQLFVVQWWGQWVSWSLHCSYVTMFSCVFFFFLILQSFKNRLDSTFLISPLLPAPNSV